LAVGGGGGWGFGTNYILVIAMMVVGVDETTFMTDITTDALQMMISGR
jgi:hypothetical protein